MKVLFLAHLFPLPLDSGGKIKSYYTLKAVASVHQTRVISFVRNDAELALVSELKEICAGVDVVPLYRGKARQLADLAGSLVRRRSFIISRDFRAQMLDAVRQAVDRYQPDVVHVDHLQMAQYIDGRGPYRLLLDNHNVESMIIKRVAETSGSRSMRLYAAVEWPKLQQYELASCRRCDLVLTVSEEDRKTLQGLEPALANVECVPIGVDIDRFQPVARRSGSHNVLSIGTMYWPPNVDSMLYFTREVLPLIRRQVSDCTLTIAGQRPVESIRELASRPGISVTGYVDDERAIAVDCGAFVVPLRSGSGVRVKILNALAMGLPVVSTSIGAEGLDVRSGEHLLIADGAEEFAQAVVRVLQDPDLADRLGTNGRKLVCERYSWQTVGAQMLEHYNRLCSRNDTREGDKN